MLGFWNTQHSWQTSHLFSRFPKWLYNKWCAISIFSILGGPWQGRVWGKEKCQRFPFFPCPGTISGFTSGVPFWKLMVTLSANLSGTGDRWSPQLSLPLLQHQYHRFHWCGCWVGGKKKGRDLGRKWSESHSVMSHSLQPRGLYTFHGILQARKLEWVAYSLLQGNFPTQVSHTAGRFFTSWATRGLWVCSLQILGTWNQRFYHLCAPVMVNFLY